MDAPFADEKRDPPLVVLRSGTESTAACDAAVPAYRSAFWLCVAGQLGVQSLPFDVSPMPGMPLK